MAANAELRGSRNGAQNAKHAPIEAVQRHIYGASLSDLLGFSDRFMSSRHVAYSLTICISLVPITLGSVIVMVDLFFNGTIEKF